MGEEFREGQQTASDQAEQPGLRENHGKLHPVRTPDLVGGRSRRTRSLARAAPAQTNFQAVLVFI